MDIKKIKIKSTGEIIEPKGCLYFSDEKYGYDIPLTNLEIVDVDDDNLVTIDEVTKWILANFDMEEYTTSFYSGVCSITFDLGRFIADLKRDLKNGNKSK